VEQRKARRFSLHLPLAITRAGSQRVEHACRTKNISSAGVLFLCNQEIAPGPIEYTVTLASDADRTVIIRCLGKIVRFERDDEENYEIAATLDRYEFVREAPSTTPAAN
jgi:hypothetical protein